jgi:uncharacterized membrane protein YeiB
MSNQAMPVGDTSRWLWLDSLRGFALFGILIANVQQMFYPSSYANAAVNVVANESGALLHWLLVDSLVTNKFFTLFSFLFGISFVLQRNSILAKTDKFRRLYGRRLLALAIFGILHGFYLYYADVLFMYAMSAIPLLFVHHWSASRLFRTGLVLLIFSMFLDFIHESMDTFPVLTVLGFLVSFGLVAYVLRARSIGVLLSCLIGLLFVGMSFVLLKFGVASSNPENLLNKQSQAQIEIEYENDRPIIMGRAVDWPLPLQQHQELWRSASKVEEIKMEKLMYRAGSFENRVEFQSGLFTFYSLIGLVLYFFWRTLALFIIAAALVKWGFDKFSSKQWQKTRTIGLSLGVLLAFAGSALNLWAQQNMTTWHIAVAPVQNLASLLLLAGVVSHFYISRNRSNVFKRWLADGGKTALSIYIGQSAVMATIAGHWGMAQFGMISHWQGFVLACIVFTGLVTLASVWLMYFRMGPLEWLWRCFTYFSFVPLIRSSRDG